MRTRLTSQYVSPKAEPQEFLSEKDQIIIKRQQQMPKMTAMIIYSQSNQQNYFMKSFPKERNLWFTNESRTKKLKHPNIITPLYSFKQPPRLFQNQLSIQQIRHSRTLNDNACTIQEYAPHGTLQDLIENQDLLGDEKLIRTIFHQIIEGLDYLHRNKCAHLDLKLENIAFGYKYIVKLIDFDLCYFEEDPVVFSCGTMNFRAPEIIEENVCNAYACDIYSAGIILFSLMAKGLLPFIEAADEGNSLDIFEKMREKFFYDTKYFWDEYGKIVEVSFDSDLKELIEGMAKIQPDQRFSLDQIKSNKWFKKEKYTQEEVINIMSNQ